MNDRLNEILNNLNLKHNGGEKMSIEEYERKRCEFMNNSTGSLNAQDGINCPSCKNKGYIYYIDSSKYIVMKDCKCMAVRRTLMRAKRSGLGNALSDCTFDKYIVSDEWQRTVKEKAQAFCKDDAAKWFYIGGQTGAGKTHICTAIAGHYIKAGFDCRYMMWREDVVKIKASVNDVKEYRKQIEEFKTVDVLYIDDFLKVKDGTEPTAADINIAFELLNYRLLDPDKVTIISSEFTILRALEIDEATIGRICQKTGIYKINIEKDVKKNYRLK